MAPLFVLARATGSETVNGTAWGTLAHFARDVSIHPGAPLLRPFRSEDLRIPYAAYAARPCRPRRYGDDPLTFVAGL